MTSQRKKFRAPFEGTVADVPPIWLMRQAGRYLPEYRAVREKAGGFLDLCYTPELAAEVTFQPIRRYGFDAAILFADILLLPHALGMNVWFEPGEGPRLAPVYDGGQIDAYRDADIHTTLAPVYETVQLLRAGLPPETTLIGFAGAPWTVATYMLAGQGVKDPSALRAFAYEAPEAFSALIALLTERTGDYLLRQIAAGAEAIQLFDSWATGLPEPFFREYCLQPTLEIATRIKQAHPEVPFLAFPKGCGPLYREMATAPDIDGVSIDTGMPWHWARAELSPHAVVQGGLDPLLLVQGGKALADEVLRLKAAFDGAPYIFNLGHGITPQVPPEHVAELVKLVREG